MKKFFQDRKVEVLALPVESSNVNHVWGQNLRAVYPNGKQHNRRNDLVWAILTALLDLSKACLQKMYRFIPRRLNKVAESKGKSIDY